MESIIVLTLVVAAVGYVSFWYYRRSKHKGGCSGCSCKCGSKLTDKTICK
ncbi:MAG: FeoB-associated Cys-rich membrane protein [Sedimentisphaerales bacterium]|nr:FeoB-associated Cys-rich membrane protein [Sedimentisphaerales bacterium]